MEAFGIKIIEDEVEPFLRKIKGAELLLMIDMIEKYHTEFQGFLDEIGEIAKS